jgi:hypothetical protein
VFQVRRFTTSALTNADTDRILADASNVLQVNDGTGDVACPVAYSRNGDVTAFSDGDGSIDSQAEFNALIGLPGQVKVVNQINWCGALIPNVIGCSPTPGSSLAVVRFAASMEGILWAHEHGHTKGLNHRNDANFVMNPVIASTARRVTADECGAYRTAPAVAAVVAEVVMPQIQPQKKPVNEFVRQIFVHGVPYKEGSQYSTDDVPTLLAMLHDPAEEPFWPNIVVVLGMIGDDQAVAPMISFIESGDQSNLSRSHYVAKTSALMALGYIINKTGNGKALEYLKQSAEPQAWAAKNVPGVAPFHTSADARDRDFSKHAILGLALSGRPEAGEVLRSLQQPSQSQLAQPNTPQAPARDVVSDAIKEHDAIASKGLATYYREREP